MSVMAFHSVAGVEAIREHFPALRRVHHGRPVAYFDGPGGTQVPHQVADAMRDYLFHHNANTHWRYPTSHETDAAIADARQAAADFVDGHPDEIVFGANMTTLTFHLARALGRRWTAGDEIVVTELDHHANVDPWRALTRDRGVVVRMAAMRPETGELDWDDLARQISPRTKLLALGAASNAIGTVNDVGRAAAMARGVGALVFVDAVHHAPHALVDVRALDCDFLAASAYKFYGPHMGLLYGRRERLAALDLPKLEPAPADPPESLETGTQNHEGIVGGAAAIDFLASLGGYEAGGDRRAALQRTYAALHERGQALVERLWDGLRAVPGVTLYGPGPHRPRTPTVSFSVAGFTSDQVATALAEQGIFASNGDFYATTLVRRLGRADDGVVRAGCACYTTDDEVERLIQAVAALVRQHRERFDTPV